MQIKEVLRLTLRERQALLFSATLTSEVNDMAALSCSAWSACMLTLPGLQRQTSSAEALYPIHLMLLCADQEVLRLTLLFSATVTNRVKDMAALFMQRLVRLPADTTSAAETDLLG